MVEIAKSTSKLEGSLSQLEGFVVKLAWVEGKVAHRPVLKAMTSGVSKGKRPLTSSSEILQ
jgi:hypothetical protein